MAHATQADWVAWTGEDLADLPADADARLEQASLDVDLAILVEYDDTDPDVLEALKRATVVQATREFDPKKATTSEWERMTLGPLTLQRAQGATEQRVAASRLVPLARDVLARAGLLYRGVNVGRLGLVGKP